MRSLILALSRYIQPVSDLQPVERCGYVTQVIGLIVEAVCPFAFIGELVEIEPTAQQDKKFKAEVVGFRQDKALLMLFGNVSGLAYGSLVKGTGKSFTLEVSHVALGSVVNGLGEPIDDKPYVGKKQSISAVDKVNPLHRQRITEKIETGISAIDLFSTIGKGQRMGVFAGSGVGKSSLLSQICNHVTDEINIIALIGERGREVQEFIQDTLGQEGMSKSIVVCATAEEAPLMRIHAVLTAIRLAEYFSQRGKSVLFTMDSITRYAMALREVGLAVGEPPTTRGYTPSVFSKIPEFVERCGNFSNRGCITAIITVLVEGDDFDDPIVDAVRAILDGHIVLTRALAEKGHFPAIDILKSTSRLFNRLNDSSDLVKVRKIKKRLADFEASQELLAITEFAEDSRQAKLIQDYKKIEDLLVQNIQEMRSMEQSRSALNKVVEQLND